MALWRWFSSCSSLTLCRIGRPPRRFAVGSIGCYSACNSWLIRKLDDADGQNGVGCAHNRNTPLIQLQACPNTVCPLKIASGQLVRQVVPSADTVMITTAPKAPGPQPVFPDPRRSALARTHRADPDTGAPLSLHRRRVPATDLHRTPARHRGRSLVAPHRASGRDPAPPRAGSGRTGRRTSGGASCHAGQRRHPAQAGPPDRTRGTGCGSGCHGIDDWAWRKGHHYGTIVVDLERRKVVDLLPDRDADTVARWLAEHPEIEVISRDRSAAYADAARRGAPQALSSGGRWHLLENLSQTVRTALDRHGPTLREAAQGVHSPVTGRTGGE